MVEDEISYYAQGRHEDYRIQKDVSKDVEDHPAPRVFAARRYAV